MAPRPVEWGCNETKSIHITMSNLLLQAFLRLPLVQWILFVNHFNPRWSHAALLLHKKVSMFICENSFANFIK